MKRLLFMVLISSIVLGVSATEFGSCLNASRPIAVRVRGCEVPPCDFVQGETTIFEIDFGVDHDVNKLEAKVLALALGVVTSYPLPKPDACQGLINGECPLDAGEEVTYRLEMPILLAFPKVHLIAQFYLESEHGIENCCQISGNVV